MPVKDDEKPYIEQVEDENDRLRAEVKVLRDRDQTASERIGKAQEAQSRAERTIEDKDAEIARLQAQLVPWHAAMVSQRINAAAKEKATGKALTPLSTAASVGHALRKLQKDKKKADAEKQEGGE